MQYMAEKQGSNRCYYNFYLNFTDIYKQFDSDDKVKLLTLLHCEACHVKQGCNWQNCLVCGCGWGQADGETEMVSVGEILCLHSTVRFCKPRPQVTLQASHSLMSHLNAEHINISPNTKDFMKTVSGILSQSSVEYHSAC